MHDIIIGWRHLYSIFEVLTCVRHNDTYRMVVRVGSHILLCAFFSSLINKGKIEYFINMNFVFILLHYKVEIWSRIWENFPSLSLSLSLHVLVFLSFLGSSIFWSSCSLLELLGVLWLKFYDWLLKNRVLGENVRWNCEEERRWHLSLEIVLEGLLHFIFLVDDS